MYQGLNRYFNLEIREMVDKPDTEILPGWSHIPDVPISISPFFSWPPNRVRMVRWITARWLALTESVILLVVVMI